MPQGSRDTSSHLDTSAPRPQTAPDLTVAARPPLGAAHLLSMQQLAGNRAVSDLVARGVTVQRQVGTIQRAAGELDPKKVQEVYGSWVQELAKARGVNVGDASVDPAARDKTKAQVGDLNFANWEKWEAGENARADAKTEADQAKEKAAEGAALDPTERLHAIHDAMWNETAKIRAEVVQSEYLAQQLNFGSGAKGTAARLGAGAYVAEWGIGARTISGVAEHVPMIVLSGLATVFGSELGERTLVKQFKAVAQEDLEMQQDKETAEKLVSGQLQAAYDATRAPYAKYMEALNAFTEASTQFGKDLAVPGTDGSVAQGKDVTAMDAAKKAMNDAAAEYQATCAKLGIKTEAKNLGAASKNIEKGREGAVETAVMFGLPEVAPGLGELKSALKGAEGLTVKQLEREGAAAVAQALTKTGESAVKAGESTLVKAGEEAVVKGGESTLVKAGEEAVVKGGESTLVKGGEEAVVKGGESTLVKAGEGAAARGGAEVGVKVGEEAAAKAGEGTAAKAPEPGAGTAGGEGSGPAFTEGGSAPAPGQKGTLLGPGEKATAEELAWQAKTGMPVKHQRAVTETCQKHQVIIDMRGTNAEAPRLLADRNLPKPEGIKAKTIDELDTYIGFRKEDQGLVGYKEPTPPVQSEVPANKWADVQDRYQKRLDEFKDLAHDMKNLSLPPGSRDQFAAAGFDKQIAVDGNGVIRVVEAEGGAGVGFTGDHDIFQITNVDGTPVSGEKYNEIVSELVQKGVGVQHGAHMHWDVAPKPVPPVPYAPSPGMKPTTPEDAAALYKDPTKMFEGIAESHMPAPTGKKDLYRFAPDGSISPIRAEPEAATLEKARAAGKADTAAAVPDIEKTAAGIGAQ
jgi:hypothetical protein